MAPTEPIRVLLAEDVRTDAELSLRELKRAGLRVEPLVVDSEAAFRRALAEFGADVVLSDFSMPQFDGMHALALARELAPETPFIFVSGTIGEEYAIRALKNGAVDYVLKSNLMRLQPAVERALAEARERIAKREADEAVRESEERFRGILEAAPDGIAVCDQDGALSTVNRQFAEIFGYAEGELPGRRIDSLIPPEHRQAHAGHFAGYFLAPRIRRMSLVPIEGVRKDGTRVMLDISLSGFHARSGLQATCIVRDITEQVLQREKLERLRRVRDLVGAVNAAIVRIRDRQALFREFCRIAVEEGGLEGARMIEVEGEDGKLRIAAVAGAGPEILGETVKEYNQDPARAKGLLADALRTGRAVVANDVTSDERTRQREQLAQAGVRAVACLPLPVEGKVVGALVLRSPERNFFDEEEMSLLRDLTGNVAFALELIDKQERLDYLALYDPLTGLPNRRLLFDRLAQAIAAARRDGQSLGLMVFDIERFKAINDAIGTAAADRLLQLVAERMQATVGDASRLARIGGDQFAVSFPALRDAPAAGRLIEKVGARFLEAPYEMDGRELRVVAKAGVSLFPEDGEDPDALYRNAEAALKRAKQTGDRYLFYAPGINASVSERLDLESRLRRAVERDEFRLHFQPKAELASRKVTGFEALLRWQSPDGAGLVSPAKFVPVLEETGLMLPVGRWVLAAAVAQHRRWREAGLNPPRVAVNVSAMQMRQKDFLAQVREALGGVSPEECALDLEITESLLMDDLDGNIRKLREVRELGVRVALDDFGTGYSSLAYLSKLPIDTVKIDRGFVRGMTENADDTSIVTTIISLAQALRLRAVAEGVESEDQARLLRLLRCDEMQGYLLSPPVPHDKAEAQFLAAGR